MKVTSEGKGNVGAVIGSEAFKVSYTKSLVDVWIKQFKLPSITAALGPQSAYSVVMSKHNNFQQNMLA